MNIKIKINKLINKLLSFNVKRTYMVTKTNEGYKLVKALNLYNYINEVHDDMFDLIARCMFTANICIDNRLSKE